MMGLQPNPSISRRRGTPAVTAPKTPQNRAIPETMANRRAGNQWAATLSRATKATATDPPIRPRPRLAQNRFGAKAKRRVPSPATKDPAASSFRGPQRSARTPVGSCIPT